MQVHQANAEILITDVGNDDISGGALVCRTNRTDCCNLHWQGEMRIGEWIYPNGNLVRNNGSGPSDPFYRSRGTSIVGLNRRNGATGPTGLYCCQVPLVADLTAMICINLLGICGFILKVSTERLIQ